MGVGNRFNREEQHAELQILNNKSILWLSFVLKGSQDHLEYHKSPLFAGNIWLAYFSLALAKRQEIFKQNFPMRTIKIQSLKLQSA